VKKKRLKQPIRIALSVFAAAVILFLGWIIVRNSGILSAGKEKETPAAVITPSPSPSPTPSPTPAPTPTPTPTPEPTKEPSGNHELDAETLAGLRQELVDDQAINGDVRCILHFNNNLVHDPVLQYSNENYYLYLNWQTLEYQSYGSIVLDSRNTIDSSEMNTIIYGHYIYPFRNPDRTLVFTPLALLTDYSVWEANRYVTVVTNHEVRYYEICAVYNCPLETMADGSQYCYEGLEYNRLEYDPEYFARYKENIKAHEYYSTGVEYTAEDRYVTLQTCIENHHESREIVLCREIERKSLD